MTKGQEIAKQIWAVPVTQLTEPDAAAAIDAAIAEAVSQRTVECAALADNYKPLQRAILRLNSPPPAPAYPFAQPCQCWHTCEPWNGKRWFREFPSKDLELASDAAFCEVCGSKRATKGE